MFKKICAVAAISAAAVLGPVGAASADTVGTELQGNWSWRVGDEIAAFSTDVAEWVLDVDDDGKVELFSWSWYN